MRIKAALYNADHLEYGLVTIPFPIPQDQYNDTIKMLEALDIGDPRAKDCMVEEIEGCVPSLKCLEGHRINVDELDYLVKRLDSFSDGELAQFQGMVVKMGLSDMTDLINLTFCCQQATVITDFSDLEQIGRDHYMNLHGGCVSMEELEQLDSAETALLLISENEGTVTPYGVVYDNGMKLSQVYQGRNFPAYLYEDSLMAVSLCSTHADAKDSQAVWLYFPTSEWQIERMLHRDGIRELTRPLFAIPTHQFLFNAGSVDKRFYMDNLQLEPSEFELIRYPQRGVCLYKCGNERYLLEVHAPPYKEKLFGTAGGR